MSSIHPLMPFLPKTLKNKPTTLPTSEDQKKMKKMKMKMVLIKGEQSIHKETKSN